MVSRLYHGNFLSCLLLLVSSVDFSASQWEFECVDDLIDFKSNHWYNQPQAGYAETSADLPLVFQGEGTLEGNGILYFEGNGRSQEFKKESTHIIDDPPTYLYLKYYGHVNIDEPTERMYVMPGVGPDAPKNFLPTTSNFQWHEELIEIDNVVIFPGFGFYIGINEFKPGEYFLLDKIIVAQGAHVTIDQIKRLCSNETWTTTESTTESTTQSTSTTEEETSTTELTTETSTESTTESSTVETSPSTTTIPITTPPPPFECDFPGHFADPYDCEKYHVCEFNEVGDLWHTEYTCPPYKVWCQRIQKCQSPFVCPCDL